MDPASLSSPWWVELLKALPSIITAGTAIVGVLIARAGLEKWRRETIGKRKVELAEEVLADFYQARDIIEAARSPGSFGYEGNTRQKAEWETKDDTRFLNAYYVTVERLTHKNEFFAQFWARRYRFLALFGHEAAKPFDELFHIRNEVIYAVRMLIQTHQQRERGSFPENRQRWEATIGWGLSEEDSIAGRLKAIIEAIEKTCRPAIQEGTSP